MAAATGVQVSRPLLFSPCRVNIYSLQLIHILSMVRYGTCRAQRQGWMREFGFAGTARSSSSSSSSSKAHALPDIVLHVLDGMDDRSCMIIVLLVSGLYCRAVQNVVFELVRIPIPPLPSIHSNPLASLFRLLSCSRQHRRHGSPVTCSPAPPVSVWCCRGASDKPI
jgi:hypothetical protein